MIEKIKITNFKLFSNTFELKLNNDVNIIVGNNEEGKTTILEAIHLALTGQYHGRNIKNGISQYLFNYDCVNKYIKSLEGDNPSPPPEIWIEIYFKENFNPNFRGNSNSDNLDCEGVKFSIAFDEKFSDSYKTLLDKKEIKTLPIEFYDVSWTSFSRDYNIIPKNIPINSAMIDSSNYISQNGTDVYANAIIKNYFTDDEKTNLSLLNRKLKKEISDDDIIKNINYRINEESKLDKNISISLDLGTKKSWEDNIITELNNIPYNNLGTGNQCMIKTNIALTNKNIEKSQIVLIEEPENHLSFSNLNILIELLTNKSKNKQLIITTHSSFVANKLGLNNLILLANLKSSKLIDIEGAEFFKKIAGYDTLRLLLCKKAILVEGDSDELIVQRAYKDKKNKLPIEDGIDVISVGTAFLRFLEIANNLNLKVNVVTDNDGDIESLNKKYSDYINENKKENIKICYDNTINKGGELKLNDKPFNYNTLEPNLLLANDNNISIFNEILNKKFKNIDELHKYMHNNKTECASQIFSSKLTIKYPKYILEAIDDE